MNGRIGVSIASYLPWSAYFVNMTARWAEEDGFAFLAVLPFRGINRISISEMNIGTRYVEGAWNPVNNLWQAITHTPSEPNGMKPNLLDWLFFPNIENSEEFVNYFNFAKRTLHQTQDPWREKFLLEVSPELGMTHNQMVNWARENYATLALDTYHMRRKRWDGQENIIGKIDKSLPSLIKRTEVIHVQPMRGTHELERTIAGEETELVRILKTAKGLGFHGEFVIEATLGIKGIAFWKLRDILRRLRDIVEKVAL